MFYDSTPSVVLPFSFLRLLTEMRKTSFVVVKYFTKYMCVTWIIWLEERLILSNILSATTLNLKLPNIYTPYFAFEAFVDRIKLLYTENMKHAKSIRHYLLNL